MIYTRVHGITGARGQMCRPNGRLQGVVDILVDGTVSAPLSIHFDGPAEVDGLIEALTDIRKALAAENGAVLKRAGEQLVAEEINRRALARHEECVGDDHAALAEEAR